MSLPLLLSIHTPILAVEVIVTVIVLGLQFYHFSRTAGKIHLFTRLFPPVALNENNIVVLQRKEGDEYAGEGISLIQLEDNKYSRDFVRMVDLINQYLEKNRHAADFGIIRSIVENNISVYEEDIVSVISLPLYIGLMGTFAGVGLGLLAIAIDGTFSEASIDSFIRGVIIAMIASFTGLLLTTINNAGRYKLARSLNEKRKNDFFNFLRIQLLPYIGNDLSSVVDTFKNNINKFNTQFGQNLRLFDEKLSANVQSLGESVALIAGRIDPLIANTRSNEEILSHLQSPQFLTLAERNVQLLTHVDATIPKLIEFSKQQETLSLSIGQMSEVIEGIRSIMDRIRHFESGLNNLGDRIKSTDYLGSQLLARVDGSLTHLDKQFELLKQYSQRSSGEIEHHFVQEETKIRELSARTLSELQNALNFNINSNPLAKLNKLDQVADLLDKILGQLEVQRAGMMQDRSLSGGRSGRREGKAGKGPDNEPGFWFRIFPFLKRGRGRK